MKRIALDTNVLVAGLLNPHGAPGRLVDLILSGDLAVVYDDRVLAEYRDVLAREKFGFDRERVTKILEYVEDQGQPVSAGALMLALPDPDDLAFVEVAHSARADALVTGNLRHYPAAVQKLIPVLSPADFLEQLQV